MVKDRSSEIVPFSRYFHFCTVLCIHVCKCNIRAIPTYGVYWPYDNLSRGKVWKILNFFVHISNSYMYITGARDVWHLLHLSTRAQSGLRAKCNKCHASRVQPLSEPALEVNRNSACLVTEGCGQIDVIIRNEFELLPILEARLRTSMP